MTPFGKHGEQSWFKNLFGIEEKSRDNVHKLFCLASSPEGDEVIVAPNGRRFVPGRFETPTLEDLRKRLGTKVGSGGTDADVDAAAAAAEADTPSDQTAGRRNSSDASMEVVNIIGSVRDLHAVPSLQGSVFQVASQFNCLEFANPDATPEDGITDYERDHTQGPACALACASSTLWRNYFLPLAKPDGSTQLGQTKDYQVNNLSDVQQLLGPDLLDVRNGYTFSSQVETLSNRISSMSEEEKDAVRASCRFGIQWAAEVTDLSGKAPSAASQQQQQHHQQVTQVFCSALALGSSRKLRQWRPLAQLILDAAYEATLAVATLNMFEGGGKDVFLTLLGGGAFGNGPQWIAEAIKRALSIQASSAEASPSSSRPRINIVHLHRSAMSVRPYRQLARDFHSDGKLRAWKSGTLVALDSDEEEEEDEEDKEDDEGKVEDDAAGDKALHQQPGRCCFRGGSFRAGTTGT